MPRGLGSPPVPVMHSPPRSVDAKEQADWKIVALHLQLEEPQGLSRPIPLDKRLAADGRGLQEVQINDNFARLSEALYLAEQKAREAVETRARIQHEILSNEKAAKEDELRELAQRARVGRVGDQYADLEARPRAARRRASATATAPATRRTEEVSRPVSRGRTRKRFRRAARARRAPRTTRRARERDEVREERRRARGAQRRRGEGDGRAGKRSKIAPRPRPRRERAAALGQSGVAAAPRANTRTTSVCSTRRRASAAGSTETTRTTCTTNRCSTTRGARASTSQPPTPTVADGAARGRGRASGPVEFQRHGGGGGGGWWWWWWWRRSPFGLDAFLDEVGGGDGSARARRRSVGPPNSGK